MQEQIDLYIQELKLLDYPVRQIKRRLFTYQRFANTYDVLTVENLVDFFESNDFLIPYYHCLIQTDILAWLVFLLAKKHIDARFYQSFDRLIH